MLPLFSESECQSSSTVPDSSFIQPVPESHVELHDYHGTNHFERHITKQIEQSPAALNEKVDIRCDEPNVWSIIEFSNARFDDPVEFNNIDESNDRLDERTYKIHANDQGLIDIGNSSHDTNGPSITTADLLTDTHSMVMSSKAGIRKPNPKYAMVLDNLPSEPRCISVALSHKG
ncbi:hypothetical protein NE237_027729 [Protea cynaroides]|uniref:Uncharacterized protein n=1 Tax=Protea cynaroides TaxID=273540 RepID=A0A9Q0JTG5_9MAGN|nr:hypothetical protein NE237_027729 [Protea cynaroides]